MRFLNVLGAITRYGIAVAACVSFAQFILLIGVSTERAQYLAGTAFARAVILGAIAAVWFYRNRKKTQSNLAMEKLTQALAEPPDTAEPLQVQKTPPSIVEPPSPTEPAAPTLSEAKWANWGIVVIGVFMGIWVFMMILAGYWYHASKPSDVGQVPTRPVESAQPPQ